LRFSRASVSKVTVFAITLYEHMRNTWYFYGTFKIVSIGFHDTHVSRELWKMLTVASFL